MEGLDRLEIITYGNPKILFNGNPVNFHFRKADAIFYIMAVEREITREKVGFLI